MKPGIRYARWFVPCSLVASGVSLLLCFWICDARFTHFAHIKNDGGLMLSHNEQAFPVRRIVRVSDFIMQRLFIQLLPAIRIVDAEAAGSKIQRY